MAITGGGALMSGGSKRKRPHKHACGVPTNECEGSFTACSNGLKNAPKMHSSPEQAFKCYARYLLRKGYTQIGPRELAAPDGGPITVLTKRSKFGARCRGGKAERFTPERTTGGHIISN